MNDKTKTDLLKLFHQKYPTCATLPISPIVAPDDQGFRPGYDIEDVKGAVGATRFANLMKGLSSTFMYGHRIYPPGNPQAGFQVHAIHADDLEKFLAGGN